MGVARKSSTAESGRCAYGEAEPPLRCSTNTVGITQNRSGGPPAGEPQNALWMCDRKAHRNRALFRLRRP